MLGRKGGMVKGMGGGVGRGRGRQARGRDGDEEGGRWRRSGRGRIMKEYVMAGLHYLSNTLWRRSTLFFS